MYKLDFLKNEYIFRFIYLEMKALETEKKTKLYLYPFSRYARSVTSQILIKKIKKIK